jgi:hypothetical protein
MNRTLVRQQEAKPVCSRDSLQNLPNAVSVISPKTGARFLADPVVDCLKVIAQFDRPYYQNLDENTYQGFTEKVRRDFIKSVLFFGKKN